ncbi:MAG: AI-2E family transporter [Gammaproteobacteria bacterium]|nr:AI-2E family transporter [Gammaproteobacteria bacterium]
MQKTDDYVARSFEVFIRLGLMLGLVVWCFQIVRPFISPIVWGMIIAIALNPIYTWLLPKFKGHRGLTATVLTLVVLGTLLTPALQLSGAMVENAQQLAANVKDGSLDIPPPPEAVKGWPLIGERTHEAWALANENLTEALGKYEDQIKAAGRWLLSTATGAGLGVLMFAVSIVLSGIFLTYAEGGNEFARKLGRRLAGERGEKYAQLAGATVRGVAQGVLGVAFIQALLAGIGFLVMGIPAAALWTLLVLILGIVQISPGLVLIPTIIYVFSTASTVPAVLYMVYMLAVGLSDNILKPILLSRGIPVPMAVIFIGAIGGFIMSGIVGLFVGAVIMVLGYDLFIAWLNADEDETSDTDEETQGV